MSALLTEEVGRKALALVRPMVEAMMANGTVKRRHLAIAILDPASEGTVYWRDQYGDPAAWANDYALFAQKKAKVSHLSGMDSHRVQQRQPHRYRKGDLKYGGGVNLDGICVGASGVEWYWDEFISHCVAEACRILCVEAMQKLIANSSLDFLP